MQTHQLHKSITEIDGKLLAVSKMYGHFLKVGQAIALKHQ